MQKNILDINEITFGEKLKNTTYFERKAVYGIVFDEGKIAAVKTPKGYFLPGGGIERNENHTQCLEREFMEETGYEIEVGRYRQIIAVSLFKIKTIYICNRIFLLCKSER